MNLKNTATPIGFVLLVLDVHVQRARSERGVSAVEWVIISAIVVGICIIVAGILTTALRGKATEIGNDIGNQ